MPTSWHSRNRVGIWVHLLSPTLSIGRTYTEEANKEATMTEGELRALARLRNLKLEIFIYAMRKLEMLYGKRAV